MEHKHIVAAFDVELDGLRQSLLEMGGKVIKMISDSVTSLVNKDTPLAEKNHCPGSRSKCYGDVNR